MHARVLALATGLIAASQLPSQFTVQIAPTRDATLYQDAGGNVANGSGQHLFVGLTGQPAARRTVIAFDVVAALPAHAHILSASLAMTVSRTTAPGELGVTLHRVLGDWGEGPSQAAGNEGAGAPAVAGDATWLHRFYPATAWLAPGGDFDPAPRARAMVPAAGRVTWTGNDALRADVQAWFDRPASNFGWLLRSEENAVGDVRRLDSRDHVDPASRPVLTVTYLPPGSVLPVGVGCVGSGGLPLHLTSHRQPVQGTPDFRLELLDGQPRVFAGHILSTAIAAQPIILRPGCTVYLAPYGLAFPVLDLFALDQNGRDDRIYRIPFEPGLLGTPLAVQSFAADQGTPMGVVLSNALMVVLR